MRFQDVDSEFAVLLLIALVAIVVLVLMVIAALAIVRSEFKPTLPHPRKEEREHVPAAPEIPVSFPQAESATAVPSAAEGEDSLQAEGSAGLLSGTRRMESGESGQPGILNQFRDQIQTLNGLVCIGSGVIAAWMNYSRLPDDLQMTSLYSDFVWLGILTPICFGIAWLRLTGSPWRRAVLLFLYVPVAFGVLLFVLQIVAFIAHIFGHS